MFTDRSNRIDSILFLNTRRSIEEVSLESLYDDTVVQVPMINIEPLVEVEFNDSTRSILYIITHFQNAANNSRCLEPLLVYTTCEMRKTSYVIHRHQRTRTSQTLLFESFRFMIMIHL